MSISRCCGTLLLLMALGMPSWSSFSRPWKPSPAQMAADYSQITDNRSDTEVVQLRWWAPPAEQSNTPSAAILKRYVLISVSHAHLNQTEGSMSFDSVDTLEARDSQGKPLVLIPKNYHPPALIAVVSGMEAFFRQSLGRFGEGFQVFVFNPGAVRACEKGRLSVLYASETYTWDTPFPHCNAP
jgi:hypothetical protein